MLWYIDKVAPGAWAGWRGWLGRGITAVFSWGSSPLRLLLARCVVYIHVVFCQCGWFVLFWLLWHITSLNSDTHYQQIHRIKQETALMMPRGLHHRCCWTSHLVLQLGVNEECAFLSCLTSNAELFAQTGISYNSKSGCTVGGNAPSCPNLASKHKGWGSNS